MANLDLVLFVVWPYVALVVAIWGGIHRYRTNRFSYSSLSSQLLENKSLFWGSVPWHYGIILILLAHLIALLIPGVWERILSNPMSLYTFEVTGFALALAALFGLSVLIVRRIVNPRIRAVTSIMDWVLLLALLL